MEKVLEVYKECNIKKFPIDCFDILRHYGFRLMTYSELCCRNPELYRLCSLFSDDAFSDQINRIIAYNTKAVSGRIRFSLMHELGHVIFQHKCDSIENEEIADCFASNMLAPRIAIKYYDCCNADKIHDTFGLSYTASNRAVQHYHKWQLQPYSEAEHELMDWLFPLSDLQKHFIKKIQKRKRSLARKMKQDEERIKFLMDNCDPFQRAENYFLYGDDL